MRKSFSLIEVLVFVTILSLFFVAAMSVSTYSLRSMKSSQRKILASHYGEEAMEWLRGEKENNWLVFSARDYGSGIYCANSLDFSTPGECGEEGFDLGNPPVFKREVTIESIYNAGNIEQINVTAAVYWKEGSANDSVILKSVFEIIE